MLPEPAHRVVIAALKIPKFEKMVTFEPLFLPDRKIQPGIAGLMLLS
jgi:hypothetical protein